MPHYRTDLRQRALEALQGSDLFSDHTCVQSFPKSIDHNQLPVIAVATPRERRVRDGLDTQDAVIDLIVVLKRKGGVALPDELDDAGDALEDLLLSAIGGPGLLTTTEVSTDVDGQGDTCVGTLVITFEASVGLNLT